MLTCGGFQRSSSLSVARRQCGLRNHKLLGIAQKEENRQRGCPRCVLLLELLVGMPQHVFGAVAEGEGVQLSISIIWQIAASSCRDLQDVPLSPAAIACQE